MILLLFLSCSFIFMLLWSMLKLMFHISFGIMKGMLFIFIPILIAGAILAGIFYIAIFAAFIFVLGAIVNAIMQ